MNVITNKEILIFLDVYAQTLGHHLIRTYLIHPQHVCFYIRLEMLPQAAKWLYDKTYHYNTEFKSLSMTDNRKTENSIAISILFEICNLPLTVTLTSELNPESPHYPAISPYIPVAKLFEEDISKQFGITPEIPQSSVQIPVEQNGKPSTFPFPGMNKGGEF